MTDSNSTNTIFSAAEGLFNISKAIQNINPEISNSILYLSDRLLAGIEAPSEVVQEPNAKPVSITQEKMKQVMPHDATTCPDCGGFKEKAPHNPATCPDCGGLKQDQTQSCGDNCPDCGGIKETMTQHQPDPSLMQELQDDIGNMCNGHTGDGSGGGSTENQPQQEQPNTPRPQSEKVQGEVRSLIEELRKGLK